MGCWTDPQCLLFVGSALVAAVAVAVSIYYLLQLFFSDEIFGFIEFI